MEKVDINKEKNILIENENNCIQICDNLFNSISQFEIINILEELAEFSKDNKLYFAYPWFLYKIGCCFYSSSDVERSIDFLEESYEIFENRNDTRGMLNTSIALISVYSCCFNFEKAVEISLRTMDFAIEIKDYEAISVLKADIVGMYIDMEDYDQAIYISKELESMSYVGSMSNGFIINLNRAICEIHNKNTEEAQKYIEKAEVLLNEKNIYLRYMLLQEKANLMKLRGMYHEAGIVYEESVNLSQKLGFTLNCAEILLDWMDMDIKRGRYEAANERAEEIISLIGTGGNCRLQRRLYSQMSRAFKAMGNSDRALFYIEKYIETDKKISEALKSPNMKELELKRAADKAQTYMTLCKQKDQLYDSMRRIMSNLNQEGIFAVIAEEIQKIGNVDIIQIISYNESDANYEYKISFERGKSITVDNLPVESDTFSGYCIRNNREIFINDIENEYTRYISDFNNYIDKVTTLQTGLESEMSREVPKSAIFVPVNYRGKVTGVISIQSFFKDNFTLEDLSALKVIAEYSGIALNNASSYKKLENSANYDFLTSLMTRSSILKTGKEIYEDENKNRSSDGLFILMIDIDDFKTVNDNYGHTVGDIVIKKVADIISYSVRANDKAGRYGGEEFIVLMNDARREVAMEVAERIRSNIDDNSTTSISPGIEINVTVSIGVSGTKFREKTIDQLIEEADKSLYRAKYEGKNKVSEFVQE